MKAGIVELHVDLSELDAEDVFEGIRAQRDRKSVVVAAIDRALREECDLVLLPGWTLGTDTVPAELVERSQGCTLVFELFPVSATAKRTASGDFVGQTHVIRDGAPLLHPVRQVLSEAEEVRDRRLLTDLARQLGNPESRRWRHHSQEALLLVCGEVNIVAGGANGPARHRDEVRQAGLTEKQLRGGRLVLNPAHTPSTLQAMRDKRAWLSGLGGCVFSTANTYSGHPTKNSAWSAASAWLNGTPAELQPVVTRGAALDYTLQTITWTASSTSGC